MDFFTIALFIIIFLATTGALFSLSKYTLDFYRGDRLAPLGVSTQRILLDSDGPRHAFSFIGRSAQEWLGGWFPEQWREAAWTASVWRNYFEKAGYRDYTAVMVFFGASVFLAITGVVLGVIVLVAVQRPPNPWLAWLIPIVFLVVGTLTPFLVLRWKTFRRQREILDDFPGSLDLIRICLEAGLGLDTAIARVGQALEKSAPALYDEFRVLSLELRAGAGRHQALERLAERIGLPEVRAWAAMILQAERFGSGVAESIRTHSEQIRLSRRLRAEERSATLSTRLLFPLIFCIFPALLTVLIGPAVITVKQQLSSTISNQPSR
jgi:tight adherence protein C